VALTVNTDDPAMVGTTLTRELERAETEFGMRRKDLIAASWRYSFS
jgi:adenosine deaminase